MIPENIYTDTVLQMNPYMGLFKNIDGFIITRKDFLEVINDILLFSNIYYRIKDFKYLLSPKQKQDKDTGSHHYFPTLCVRSGPIQ